jgi:hypothetical protein
MNRLCTLFAYNHASCREKTSLYVLIKHKSLHKIKFFNIMKYLMNIDFKQHLLFSYYFFFTIVINFKFKIYYYVLLFVNYIKDVIIFC